MNLYYFLIRQDKKEATIYRILWQKCKPMEKTGLVGVFAKNTN